MNTIDSLKIVLEFYRDLGFDRLPIKMEYWSNGIAEKSSHHSNTPTLQHFNLPPHIGNHNKVKALEALREEIGDCRRCKLSKGRTNIVFGEGNANAPIMFIGEAPGKDEDIQARPFVGEAGQILTSLINNMGKASGSRFGREDVYIANIVKCRPAVNRDPHDDEIAACLPFLERQIDIIAPRVIMALGKIASHTLMGLKTSLAEFSIVKVRGHFFEYKGIPVMPTFHPAYFLRNPKDKQLTWADAQAVLKKLGVKS
ncbi:MAG: uracil-DNA glycosylase [Nitrospirae bacterium]|nr:uracil-DNA glycosylase [Nitrospirota bacterium]